MLDNVRASLNGILHSCTWTTQIMKTKVYKNFTRRLSELKFD